MSPEEEAERLNENLAAAEAAGDITTIVSLLAGSAQLTVEDYVQKTIGNIMFLYYMHLDNFHTPPRDMDDLVDGLLFTEAKGYIKRRAIEDAKRDMSKR